MFTHNPYRYRVYSPYSFMQPQRAAWSQYTWAAKIPDPGAHARTIHQTISLNNELNKKAQADIDNKEPKISIWDDGSLSSAMSNMAVGDTKAPIEKPSLGKRQSTISGANGSLERPKQSRFSSFRSSIGFKVEGESAVAKTGKAAGKGQALRDEVVAEETGRWPDEQWRSLVATYQEKVGMSTKIADLRARHPIQYLHLLRAGYFEPIPVAWATQASNPLKFSIEAAAGWRGITPAWRGYEDTAEERLYWVLNHREGSVGSRMKPDFISAMDMARARMATAVEPPPVYSSPDDTCNVEHTTSAGYSKQVMPPPFRPYDRPEAPTDDTMILLDTSGSMDFNPVRPVYNRYLITRYEASTQPKNKGLQAFSPSSSHYSSHLALIVVSASKLTIPSPPDVAKAIIRRFTDAMANHDHQHRGYDLTTFANTATYIGTVNHTNLDTMWSRKVRLGGGTRVMTGWQRIKDLHFQKHSESAIHHPIFGWQAGPSTPMLRLLLLLDGEATDMDEFELDLLGLSWAHVTIFLIGVDGCPHHHRHANELQRISDVNHHVSFVDAQGNMPERFVTHELLKRHLGYDVSMREFEAMEALPAYEEVGGAL